MKSLAVYSDVKSIYYILNNLTESKCNNGKIIAFKSEYGYTDKETEKRRNSYSDNKSYKKSWAGRNPIRHNLGKSSAGKSTDTHKSAMTDTELTQNTNTKIERNRDNRIICHRNQ